MPSVADFAVERGCAHRQLLNANPSAPWHVLLHRRLPVAAVEALRCDGKRVEPVEATGVDVDLVRVGARHIERMDAAHLAEMMLGDLGVELIGREIARALQQIEPLGRSIPPGVYRALLQRAELYAMGRRFAE